MALVPLLDAQGREVRDADGELIRVRRPRRPQYWRALRMLRSGEADGVLFVDSDRGIGRHPRDLEDAIDVAELYGIPFRSMTDDDLNLNTHAGRARARRKVAHDSESSADTSRRVARTRKRHAHAGLKVGGWRRFGWEPGNQELRSWEWPGLDEPPKPGEEGWDQGRPAPGSETAEIASWAAQVLSGVTLRYIALDLRQRGVLTSHKGTSSWSPQAVREILLHPAIMGKLVYRPDHPAGVPRTGKGRLYTRDEIIGDAPWPPIISESDYWAVRAVLTDESRRLGPGNTPKWLLSSLAVCARCGDIIQRATGVGRFGAKEGQPETPCYRCRSCSGLRRPVEFADAVVRGVITRYLAREDAGDLLPSPRAGPDRAALEAERTALRGRRAVQLRLHAEGSIDDDELKTALETFGARLAVISAELENTGRHSVLTGIAGRPDAAQVWDGLTLGLRREVIRACCEDPPVVFLPGKPPDVFNPELIKLNIKGTPGTVRPVRVHRAPSRRRGRVPKNA